MKLHLIYIYMLLGTALASCTSLQYLPVDTLVPADVSFAPTVRRLGVLDNAWAEPVDKHQAVTVGATLMGNGALLAEQIACRVADAEYFDQVVLADSSLRGNGTRQHPSEPIPPSRADALMRQLQVDMLLSVDGIRLKNKREVVADNRTGEPVPGIATSVEAEVRLYLPGRERPFQRFVDADTLYWSLEGLTDSRIVKEATEFAATLPLAHIVPQWQQAPRYYYAGGSYQMRDAHVCVQAGNWEEACRLWKQAYHSKKKGKARMRAAFNIALYHEMQGDFREALRYVEEAARLAAPKGREEQGRTHYNLSDDWHAISLYREELQEKIMLQEKLDLQMRRFRQEN